MKAYTKNHVLGYVKYLIGYGHGVLRRETDEKCRENTFNEFSQDIAEILQIKPLEYTKERAANYRKEMSAYVNKLQIKITPYKTLCYELRKETDEDRRKALFDWMTQTIVRPLGIKPLEYTKERADHFHKEITAYVSPTLKEMFEKEG